MVVALAICNKKQQRAALDTTLLQMPDGYAKYELLLQALESELEYSKHLLEGGYQPENTQGRVVLNLCDEIGSHIHFPGSGTDSDSS